MGNNNKGISSHFSVSAGSSSSELDAFKLILDSELIQDVVAITQQTPLELICQQEENNETITGLNDLRKEVISGLLSFLFKNVRGYLPSPQETVTRLYTLVYLVSPHLINGMSLSSIGKVLGEAFDCPDISRQTLSARTKKYSSALGIKARSQKSEVSNKVYKALATERWEVRHEEERKAARDEYQKRYREKNRIKKREQDKAYYLANRKRILEQRKKKRNK